MRYIVLPLFVAIFSLLIGACSSTGLPVAETGSPILLRDDASRWHIWRFRFARSDDGWVNTYLDGMLADQLLFDAVTDHADRIELWRFHRRWANDSTGHQFSLMVFAPADVGRSITTRLTRAPLLKTLTAQGYLVQWRIDPPGAAQVLRADATSDPLWSAEIQREWPHFIMGVSRFWGGLVRSEARRFAELPLHERYREADSALADFWLHDARHTLLHHLNALFGYRALLDRNGSLRRF